MRHNGRRQYKRKKVKGPIKTSSGLSTKKAFVGRIFFCVIRTMTLTDSLSKQHITSIMNGMKHYVYLCIVCKYTAMYHTVLIEKRIRIICLKYTFHIAL